MAADLDLLALAEDVAAGRRSLDNVIDQISVATPDDRKRREAVAELQALVVGLTGVRAHARATAEAAAREPAASGAPVTIATGPVGPRRPVRRVGLGPLLAGGASLVVGILVLVVAIGVLRPAALVGGPSPSIPSSVPAASGAAATSSVSASAASPSASASAPSAEPTPVPTSAPSSSPSLVPSGSATSPPPSPPPAVPSTSAGPGSTSTDRPLQPAVVIWQLESTSTATTMAISRWLAGDLVPWLRIDVRQPVFGFDTYRVLAAPDGSLVAVSERGAGSDGRVRVFNAQGRVIWSGATGSADVLDLAWSVDGVRLAFGQQPSPWTVLTFSPNGDVAPTTYELPGDRAYRLLTFTGDGNSLVGYETTGEADFWEQPMQMDLADGRVAPLSRYPAGLSPFATGPVQRIDPGTGDVLARAGGAKGPPAWVVRHGSTETPVAVADTAELAWTDDGRIVAADELPQPAANGGFISEISILDSPSSTPRPVVELPPGFAAAPLGVRDGPALFSLFPSPAASYPVDPGFADFVFVDLQTGATVYAVPRPTSVVFHGLGFGGWLGPDRG